MVLEKTGPNLHIKADYWKSNQERQRTECMLCGLTNPFNRIRREVIRKALENRGVAKD